MCGRYVIVQKIEKIEKRFNVEAVFDSFPPNFNVGPGMEAPIITCEQPQQLQLGSFGFVPDWDTKKLILNARDDKLLSSNSWKRALKFKRCIVLADCFYEGPEKEKLSKPFVVYLQDAERPFGFAGIYNEVEKEGELIRTFAIITTTPSKVLNKIGHHRSPVILNPNDYNKWLTNNQDLFKYTDCIKNNINEQQNAYPVGTEVKSVRNNSKSLVEPIGERIIPEYEYRILNEIDLQGMGSKNRY